MMTEEQMKEQLNLAQSMINAIKQQRDAEADKVVVAAAQIEAAQRKIKQLEAKVAEYEAASAAQVEGAKPIANGHADEATLNA